MLHCKSHCSSKLSYCKLKDEKIQLDLPLSTVYFWKTIYYFFSPFSISIWPSVTLTKVLIYIVQAAFHFTENEPFRVLSVNPEGKATLLFSSSLNLTGKHLQPHEVSMTFPFSDRHTDTYTNPCA